MVPYIMAWLCLCSYAATEADDNSNRTLEQRAVLAESRRCVSGSCLCFLFSFSVILYGMQVSLRSLHGIFKSLFYFGICYYCETTVDMCKSLTF